jgi:hypothetical protein
MIPHDRRGEVNCGRNGTTTTRKRETREGLNHTSYCPSLFRVLATHEEDHVPLGGIDIVVLEEEDFVDAIFLESAELDKQSNSSSQGFFNDQVLLASDLEPVSCYAYLDRDSQVLHTPSSMWSRSRRALSVISCELIARTAEWAAITSSDRVCGIQSYRRKKRCSRRRSATSFRFRC